MTITLENVNAETLQVIESLQGLNKDLIITTQKNNKKGDKKRHKQSNKEGDECPICKAHNYTPKMTKAMKKALKQSEDIAKNPHKYPSYTSIAALREALESDDEI